MASVVRMLGTVAVLARLTWDSAAEPSFTRSTARLIESPATKPFVVTGMVAPCCVTLIDTVPVATSVAIGVVLSVNEPKVPRPATATAAPSTPNEGDDPAGVAARADARGSGGHAVSCAGPVCRGIPATDRP